MKLLTQVLFFFSSLLAPVTCTKQAREKLFLTKDIKQGEKIVKTGRSDLKRIQMQNSSFLGLEIGHFFSPGGGPSEDPAVSQSVLSRYGGVVSPQSFCGLPWDMTGDMSGHVWGMSVSVCGSL